MAVSKSVAQMKVFVIPFVRYEKYSSCQLSVLTILLFQLLGSLEILEATIYAGAQPAAGSVKSQVIAVLASLMHSFVSAQEGVVNL